ncbi:thiamine-phosphate pyrophosphorylase [Mobilisporobacter senegalensis]|uniref:Thiamine-phosphate synthase n=1 Tax=Mobilisporobacter senegalensis TaxID=1329262 RepID=A0A3N1XRW5_9FIRM|nr:thiamine phosphate synthase [Mobilisporobacter senegalensis]ROR29375.1 thiamine-phosphate pyrophosphorylase [Mobilisporobacter senegalensis]
MNFNKDKLLLYGVTDRSWLKGDTLESQVEKAILGGITSIQLREKDLDHDEFLISAKKVKRITDQYKVPFIINDNVEIALEVDADGVHIGQSDEDIIQARKKLGRNKIIGVSAHNVLEAIMAEENGADYIGVGAVFHTNTKSDAGTVSYETLKEICNRVKIPVVAIGGITRKNIMKLSGSGIDGVAVISAIFGEQDITKASQEMHLLVRKELFK